MVGGFCTEKLNDLSYVWKEWLWLMDGVKIGEVDARGQLGSNGKIQEWGAGDLDLDAFNEVS